MKFLGWLLVLLAVAGGSAVADPTYRVFVSNERDNTITVIDSRSNQVEATLPVGERPRGIGLSPDHKFLYVAVSEDDAIAVVSVQTLEVLRHFQAGSDPEAFAVHPNGNLYLSNEDAARVTAIDPKRGQIVAEVPVGLEPEGVAVSPDGSRALVTSESMNMVHVIDTADHQVVANILVGARPRGLAFSPDGLYAYATSEIGIDMQANEILKRTRLEDIKNSKPMAVVVSLEGTTLYVTTGRGNCVAMLDAGTLELKAKIPVGKKRVWGAALTRNGSRLYTADGISNTVSVIDTVRHEKVAAIAVGEAPWGVVIDD